MGEARTTTKKKTTRTGTGTRPKPQRTCVGCGQVLDKRDMVRVVRTPGGEVMADPSGKAAGRGAYLHAQAECWETGLKKGRLAHSLKVTVSPANADALREYARGLGLVEVTS